MLQILSSVQSALQLVHAYPYLLEPTPLLKTLAEQCGQSPDPSPAPLSSEEAIALEAQHEALRRYVNHVTAKDCFEHASMTSVRRLCPVKPLQNRQHIPLDSHRSYNAPAGHQAGPQLHFLSNKSPHVGSVAHHAGPQLPDSQRSHHDAAAFEAGPQRQLLDSQRLHVDTAADQAGPVLHLLDSSDYHQSPITVPTLDELLLDEANVGLIGPDLRRGFNHVFNMPQDHKFVRLLGELAGPPVFPPAQTHFGASAPVPQASAGDPFVALSLEMLGRS